MVRMFGWLSEEAARAFRLQPIEHLRFGEEFGREKFKRRVAAEPRIQGEINLPHTAGAQAAQNAIRTQLLTFQVESSTVTYCRERASVQPCSNAGSFW